jgi:hypothetical protein
MARQFSDEQKPRQQSRQRRQRKIAFTVLVYRPTQKR